MVYLGNLVFENSLSKYRRFETRLFATTFCGSNDFAKDRTPVGNHHSHLICSWHSVVVPIHASCLTTFAHRFIDVSSTIYSTKLHIILNINERFQQKVKIVAQFVKQK